MKFLKIFFTLVLLGALIGGLVLVKRNQETRRGAFFGTVSVQLLPSQQTVNRGENFFSTVLIDAGSYKLNGYDIFIKFDKDKLRAVEVIGLNSVLNVTDYEPIIDQNAGTIRVTSTTNAGEASLPTGIVNIFKVKFEAKALGAAEVKLEGPSKIVGYNVGDDGSLAISSLPTAVYTVIEGAAPTATGVPGAPTATPTLGQGAATLNFRMAFDGVKADAGCANWKVKALVIAADGSRKDYGLINLTKDGIVKITRGENEEEYQVYKGSIQLTGMSQRSGLALLLKGPKHLQTKYGVDGQTEYYNRSEGELVVSEGENSPVYNFSGYPMLAGDVVGAGDEPDGVADGRDFAFVKAESLTRRTVSAGQDMKADLDGNCVLISTDITRLMMALAEKQGQLY